MTQLPETSCDLCAMVLSMNDDVKEDLMQHRFKRVPFRVSIGDQVVEPALPGVEQVFPGVLQGGKAVRPRLRVDVRPGREPGKRLVLDARQPDFLGRNDVRQEFSQRVAGGKGTDDGEGFDGILIADGLVPAGRWGEGADIGRIVAALAGGGFGFAMGSVINADGALAVPRL